MKRKILSALLVLALALGCIFSLTACKMADEDYTEAVNGIAKTWYEEHKDYKNFADTTIAITITASEQEYSYEVDGAIDKEEIVGTAKYSFKKAGDALLVYSDIASTTTETVNYNDYATGEAMAKVKTIVTNYTVKVETFVSVEGEDTYYYVTAVYTQKEDDSIDPDDGELETYKIYKRFADVEDYIELVEDLIYDTNDVVSNAFDTATTNYLNQNRTSGAEIKIDKKGDDIKYALTYNGFYTGSKLYETTQNLTVEFVDNKVSKIAQDFTHVSGELVDTDKTEIVITAGSELVGTVTKDTIFAENSGYEWDHYGMLTAEFIAPDVDFELVPAFY